MKRYLFAAALVALPSAALAQSQLDRLEAASETMSSVMVVMMANEVAANGGNADALLAVTPDFDWDAEMREAGNCMLEEYTALLGDDGVDEMLTAMEGLTDEVTALAEAGEPLGAMPDTSALLPEGLTPQLSAQITQGCGMIALQMERMDASGFTAAMMEAAQ